MTTIEINCIQCAEEGQLLGKDVHKILWRSYRRYIPVLQQSYWNWHAADAGLPLISASFSQLYWGRWLLSEVWSYLDVLDSSRSQVQSICVKTVTTKVGAQQSNLMSFQQIYYWFGQCVLLRKNNTIFFIVVPWRYYKDSKKKSIFHIPYCIKRLHNVAMQRKRNEVCLGKARKLFKVLKA